jgi:S-adenosylmethionine hydrolase
MARPVITLLTDFGHKDPFVGMLKGQILRRCPDAQLVDLTHEIPPHDVRAASFHLEQSVDYFPPETVHLAVVDPGVGTSRRILAVRTNTALLVAPDNGLLTRALVRLGEVLEIVEVPARRTTSATFHGRDIMAPAAAEIAKGRPLWELGPGLEIPMMKLSFEPAILAKQLVQASVLIVDHFGNLTLDLSQAEGETAFTPGSRWSLGGHELSMNRTYGEVARGESLLLWSSHGMLELACREARADTAFGLQAGQRVELTPMAGSRELLE